MEKHDHTHSVILENQIAQLSLLRQAAETCFSKWNINPSLEMPVQLAIEEAFTNIVNYGYKDQLSHTIEVVFYLTDDTLHIRFTDDGIAYDPTAKDDPDTAMPASERPIGGLGIFLIKKLMDRVEYQRTDNQNILTLIKQLPK